MDSETALVGRDGSSGRGASPSTGFVPATPFVPSVRIRASPSFDDDSGSDFEVGSDDAEESGRKEFGISSSFRVLCSVSGSSEENEDEEEGGFVSGDEFDKTLERPYVAEVGGVDNSVAFMDRLESMRPIAKLSANDDDDDDDIEVNGWESGEENGIGFSSIVAMSEDEPKGEELDSSEKPDVAEIDNKVDGDGIDNGVSEALVVSEGRIDNGVHDDTSVVSGVGLEGEIGNDVDDEVKVPETTTLIEVISEPRVYDVEEVQSAVVKPVGDGMLEVDGVKFTTGGDCIVESINVDVNAAEPGVAVVEDVKPAIVLSSSFVNPEEDSLATKISGKEINEEFGDAQVVRAIQADLQEPGRAVANGLEENINMPAIKEKDVTLDTSSTEENSSYNDRLSEDKLLVANGEDCSIKVVDIVNETKGSEINGEEIFANGRSVEAEEVKLLAVKPENEAVIIDDVNFIAEGDSLAEMISPDVSEPGVVVVKDTEDDENSEARAVESIIGEAAESLNELDQKSVAAGDVKAEEIQEANDHLDEVSDADDDDKLETGIDQDERRNEEESADDEIKQFLEVADDSEGSASDDETDGITFGSSEAAKQFLEELEQRSVGGSHSGAESSRDRSQTIDGRIVSNSDEEEDSDEEGSGKELFDSAALAALLKAAASGGGSSGNNTLSAQDVSDLFSVNRPSGLGSSLRAGSAPRQLQSNLFSSNIVARAESEDNLSEEEMKKLESIQQLRVKFLRLVYRLGLSSEDPMAAQVLYRLVLLAGRYSISLDAAKRKARELESQDEDNLNFSLNILVIGKSGVGKSATINSIFSENVTGIDAFVPATTSVKEITGLVDGVRIRIFDTPGLNTSIMDQVANRKILASVKKATKKCPPDIVLYVDRLDSQTRDLNDLPLLRTISDSLGPTIWRNAIVTLTHAASTPPDGPSGAPLSYEIFVAQRSHAVQHSIGQAVGDIRLMNPSQMNPVSLVENHHSCRKNIDGEKILPNGQMWRSQLLLFCYSMKILSEASALTKKQDPFDSQKLFGFRMPAPPLPYLLSWLLQSRNYPKLSVDQGGDNGDSDLELDDLSESEGEEEEHEYDQLPPFKPLRKSQLARLSSEQRKAYYEEYDYRVKLLQKKQLKEELKRMKEARKGKIPKNDFLGNETDPDDGAPAAVPVPLPDMVLPPTFDCDNPAYRYRFLEPSSQFLARPVLDNHGWDHDCGYDGVALEQSLSIASQFPASVTVQLTKDKKEFDLHLDSSIAAKHGENASTMAGFDIQNIGKKLAYIVMGEAKFKNFKKNKTTAGFSLTFLGENIVTGLKIEDQIPIGKRLVLAGSTGTARSQGDAVYGANLEVKLREADFPIGQDQSSLSLSLVKWRKDLALGANLQSQFSVGRGSKIAIRFGLNNKSSGQITVRASTSDQLQLALVGIVPLLIGIYRAVKPGASDD